jgi:adenosylcobinamide-phosphate synthase
MTLLTLILALALDVVFGDPPNHFHPVVAMGNFIRWAADRAPQQGQGRQFWYGILLTIVGVLLFSLPLWLVNYWLTPYPWVLLVVNAVLLKATFSMRRLLEAGQSVERALEQNQLEEARRLVKWHLVSRDTTTLDVGHVASATIESLAENFPDSFLAPLLAFAVGGLPLAWAYRFINTADSMIGFHIERYEYLGKFAARLDDVLNLIPARLAAVLLALATPSVNGSFANAWRTMFEEHGRTLSPNAGWPMSTMAGALNVTLEKIKYYTLEGGPALPIPATIRKARWLVAGAGTLGSLALMLVFFLLAQ